MTELYAALAWFAVLMAYGLSVLVIMYATRPQAGRHAGGSRAGVRRSRGYAPRHQQAVPGLAIGGAR